MGRLSRTECAELVVGYTFDLVKNNLTAETIPNPNAEKEHRFVAYCLKGQGGKPVSMAGGAAKIVSDRDEE